MNFKLIRCVVLTIFIFYSHEANVKHPTVLISILVRNKAHTLPYFLTLLENLNYPKERIALWIRSDHNIDKSTIILRKWLNKVESKYHLVNAILIDDDHFFQSENGIAHWTDERFNHIINLRESSLEFARQIWADYYWSLDADAILTNSNVLENLIKKNLTVAAPLLRSDGLYSNFWHGMTEDYYYERTEDYKPVLNRERIGCFNVPMIHSSVLINLRRYESDKLTYSPKKVINYNGPHDDIIAFALSARSNNINMHVCNDEVYGYIMVPLEPDDTLNHDYVQLTNLKLEMLNWDVERLPFVGDLLAEFVDVPEKDQLGFDKIFMINLLRRPERRVRMRRCFEELGLDVETVDAVDGRALNDSFLEQISFLPEYADPYHKRPMTLGEIGCFMSHYNIWQNIIENGYETSLILEDDIRFEPFFRIKVHNLMEELRKIKEWDLVYFGRKRLLESEEPWVPGSKYLVEVSYSYWTLGYALTQRGAEKLIAGDPLSKLLPVDEYLPILFDKHPQETWKQHYPKRDLVAFSVAPLLLYPTHYTGENGYISDTEDSKIVRNDTDAFAAPNDRLEL